MKVKFCGAAQIVTGSCYHLDIKGKQYLVDCGMFQGKKEVTKLNYEKFAFDPKKIDFLFLTHAHIDHSGLIPKLVSRGFKGRILTTSATTDLCKIMFVDSAGIQESDTRRENSRRARDGLPAREPLYTVDDAKHCIKHFRNIKYDKTYTVDENVKVRYRDAGHIVGAAIIEIFIKENGKEKKLVFSGDLGQWDIPIVKDPTLISEADYVFIESTYGDRIHKDKGKGEELLLKHIIDTYKRGGKLLIPSFAIERTQELLFALHKFAKTKKMPKEKVFLDSPLAIRATKVFEKHTEVYDEEIKKEMPKPFYFDGLEFTQKTNESMKLNHYNQPAIIIAGSGMCTGGRIRHHFKHGLWDPKNTVLFVGYQAEGTLGRHILEGAKKVRMLGTETVVKAKVVKINSFSAHADYRELIKWLDGFKKKPTEVFIVHSEKESMLSFKTRIDKKGYKSYIPKLNQVVKLN
ncbi:MBL fold metallo-hydrolase [Candidatus Woesearchaeota archaeon]|jgi:metallo-beta-lactamase family protein|nr:MBL fold metallo-hydrolase [Candidatus Woesearchaeota archaeon]MBT7238090.1 MBL fold metallo-hydrolase [Candidatus Woesearchaeota archaeon]